MFHREHQNFCAKELSRIFAKEMFSYSKQTQTQRELIVMLYLTLSYKNTNMIHIIAM